MADEVRELSELIGDIHDAALDPDRWEDVLARAARFLNAMNTSLGSSDLIRRDLNLTKLWGYDPDCLRSLQERYHRINPTLPLASRTKTGDVLSIGEFMPYEEFLQSTMYREWAKPQGFIDGLQATLDKTAIAIAFFTAARHERQGRVDEEMRLRMKLLYPHFRRAILIGKVIDLHRIEAAALADALDRFDVAVILVDADAAIMQANARANALLDEGTLLRRVAGRLEAPDPVRERALRSVFAAASRGDLEVGDGGIAIPLNAENARYVAHVLPLTAGARRIAGVNYAAVAALFVRKADLEGPFPLDAIADTYQLSPAELRVMMMAVELGGVPEIAPALGVSESTVRTHLQRIFDKTGCRRQADLVKLVASYMSPVAG